MVLEGYGSSEEVPSRVVPVVWPAVLEGAALEVPAVEAVRPRSHRVLALSAKSAAALPQLAQAYLGWFASHPEMDAEALADLAYTAGVGRSHFGERAGLVFEDAGELKAGLEALASGVSAAGLLTGSRAAGSGAVRVAFVFTGQGSQWVGMGQDLYESEPVFRAVLDRCDGVLRDLRGVSLLDVMFGREGAAGEEPGDLNDTAWTQPGLYALEAGLTALWRSVGVEPCVVLGHSVGELAAAHAAGVLSLEEGLRLAASRGSLMGALPVEGDGCGAMAAVFAGAGQVAAGVAEINEATEEGIGLSVAADNGLHQVVSGPAGLVAELEDRLSGEGVRVERLATSHGFHSALMDPVLDDLEAVVSGLSVARPRVPLISNVTGRVVGENEMLDGAYWRRHAREAVRFADGVAALAGEGVDLLIEVGPHGVLGPMAMMCWPEDADQSAPPMIASLVRDGKADASYALALAGLYAAGADLDFGALHSGEVRRKLSLPGTPFQRQRYWIDPPRRRRQADGHPLLGTRRDLPSGEVTFENVVFADDPSWLSDHRVFGRVVAPGALYGSLALEAGRAVFGGDEPVALEALQICAPLVLEEVDGAAGEESGRTMQVVIGPADDAGSRSAEIYSRGPGEDGWRLHAEGRVSAGAVETAPDVDPEGLTTGLTAVDVSGLYGSFADLGLGYGASFQDLEAVWSGTCEAVGEVVLPAGLETAALLAHPSLLDGCFQVLAAAMGEINGETGNAADSESAVTYLPFGWERLWLSGALPQRVLCHARLRPVAKAGGQSDDGDSDAGVVPQVRLADLSFYDPDGRPLGGVMGFSMKRATRAALLSASERIEDLLYEVVWRGVIAAADDVAEDDASDEAAVGPVLLIDGGDGSAPALAAIADGLTARGVSVVTGADEDPARLLDSVLAADEPDLGGPDLGGIVYVAAAGAGEEDEADPAEASLQRLGWLLRLVQETVSAEVPLPLGLTVVTAGGVAAEPGEAVDPEQASIWGFVRSVQTEQPQLGLRLLDMEPGAATDEELIALLAGAGPDPQLALRGGQLLAPRLGRTAGLAEASPTIRGDSSYLVTGGLGALGLEAAGWLARSGAGHVVLAGRRAPDTTVQERLSELEAQTGCVIATACVDVSDGAAVAALVGRFAANDVPTDTTEERTVEPSASETLWPPLAGVIHAAGVLDDGVVTAQTGERLACVLGPKARGAWHLHEASLDRDLDLFVLYSSVAATLGSPGQSNYAAANGFLDGLAAHRQSLGLAATSVAWGPWSSGMTEDAAVKASMARQGLRPLSAGPAQGALARLLAGGRSFGVVLDADWRRMGEGLGAVRPAMLSGLLAAPTALQAGSGALLSRLRQTPAAERESVLVAFLQDELQAVLGLADVPPASAGFFDLGLDSLMAVELRNRLNAALDGAYEAPNTVAFDHPTVDKLARHIAGTIQLGEPADFGSSLQPERVNYLRTRPVPGTIHPGSTSRVHHVQPRSPTERLVAETVAHLLGVEHVGIEDNILELDGHRLLAGRLAVRLLEASGRRISVAAVLEAQTIGALAKALESDTLSQGDTPLVRFVDPTGPSDAARPPLFCLHQLSGHAVPFRTLVAGLSDRFSVVGVQARGVEPGEEPFATYAEMLSCYRAAITAAQPEGPLHLLGWSMGGYLAHDLTCTFESEGRTVDSLILLDSIRQLVGKARNGETVLEVKSRLPLDPETLDLITGLQGEGASSSDRPSQLRLLAAKMVDLGIVGVESLRSMHLIEPLLRLMAHHGDLAQESGLTRRHSTPTLVIRARDSMNHIIDPAMGWAPFCGPVSAVDVPFEHFGLLQKDAALVIAEAIKEWQDARGRSVVSATE